VSDPLAIRVKQENQLIEELDKVGNEVLKKCPQIGSAIEDAVMKSLFMWHGCLNIDKVCRLRDAHGLIMWVSSAVVTVFFFQRLRELNSMLMRIKWLM
jgi:hypothetical protein